MLNDERSINMVDEMLGIIPGQTRSYVSSATGSISMGGTPLCPQQLPIHTANSITGITAGALSNAAATIATANAGTGLTTTADSTTFTKSTGTLASGDAVYALVGGETTYIGTVLTITPAFTFVNYPTNVLTSSAYTFIPAASKGTVAYTYDVTMPTTTITAKNVSYTIQAGDDFEQEVMKYAKCLGFSVSGGSGGAIDMNAQYMGQAVQLGYVGQGTITSSTASTTVTGVGTVFVGTSVSSDVGRKLYTLDNELIGTIASVTNATTVVLNANALTTVTFAQYRLGGFTKDTQVAAPVDDLIFARTRLFIDNVQAWPVARPTVVQYQFLAFSTSLQCSWTPKFTGEGYQGIDPTWSFALFTNYQVGGDFTIEHDTIASAKKSASSVESLRYAWRNRVPKIVQIDCPSSTAIKWFTVGAVASAKTLTYTYPATPDAGTISIDAATPTAVTGVGTNFVGGTGKALCVKVGGSYYYVGKIVTASTLAVTLDANLYGTIPAGSSFALDATKVTGGASSFAFPGTADVNKDLFQDATTWIGRIASVDSATVAHTYVSSAIGTFSISASPGYILDSCTTQPYFPVVGKGPLETYTGVSFRFPVQIMSVSSINDQDGNDIVTVSWQMRYDTTVGDTGGDVRIVNQIPSLSVAN